MKLGRVVVGMCAFAVLSCSGNLCIIASKQHGKVLYSSLTVTLLAEVLKAVAMLGTIVGTGTSRPARFEPIETLFYAVPSLLYTIDNNLNYVILRFMDATTLAVLWNLKIVVTAVLFRFVLKRTLSELRKIAIVLLLVGVLTSQSTHLRAQGDVLNPLTSSRNETQPVDTLAADASTRDFGLGVLLVLVGVTLSSCASVFTEWTFKRKSDCPFLWQNLQMYVFGIAFNTAGVLLVESDDIVTKGFFHDFNHWTVAVIAVHSIGGIGVGFILKYLDNIACVYAHAMAMVLTMLFSMVFFSFSPTLELGCGLTVLLISMYIYHHPLATIEVAASLDAAKSCQSSTMGSERHGKSTVVRGIKKERRIEIKEQEVEDEDEDDSTDTCSILSSSSDSLSSLVPRSTHKLQLKKTQYSTLASESL
ncbi:unnamed protein product [Hyaloperonospora brassicae]|uniref:Sugar phosphate transporter domain-containing protein n=1 Tax=Hyaloperonospora brassicae TaxID=162125 RepID=A0AAV0T6X6_HYABA|nr:unnamed protein product [Hyaloperonospora brassicae]